MKQGIYHEETLRRYYWSVLLYLRQEFRIGIVETSSSRTLVIVSLNLSFYSKFWAEAWTRYCILLLDLLGPI